MPNHRKSKTSFVAISKRFLKDWTGATAPEYALMLALVIVGAIGAMGLLGDRSTDVMDGVAEAVRPRVVPVPPRDRN